MKSRRSVFLAGDSRFRTVSLVAILAALAIPLSGCAPEPVVPSPSVSSPSPSVSSSPSATPSETPEASSLVIPDDCDEMVPISVVHDQFSPDFEPIFITANDGDPAAQDFAARNGLTCLWGIPNSDAGFLTVFVAERDGDSDSVQVAEWQGAGYTECPPFLDECYYEDQVDEIGEVWTAHILVEGFELRVQATAVSLDPLLIIARSAATNMGYV